MTLQHHACAGRGNVVSFSPMAGHEWQIPRGGVAEGRTLFRRGRVLPSQNAAIWHRGITAKNGLSCVGLNCSFSACCAPCKFVSFVLFSDAHSAPVRTGRAVASGGPRPVAATRWGEASRRAAFYQPRHPSTRIGGRVRERFLFSHARHSSFLRRRCQRANSRHGRNMQRCQHPLCLRGVSYVR